MFSALGDAIFASHIGNSKLSKNFEACDLSLLYKSQCVKFLTKSEEKKIAEKE
jgi:hypothetical protein